ncbi:SMI1/KNR4 family protein [Candidatus Tisiphia endosymbiont of Xenochironomus xenolabis]|uniref:SMI1/KNR4 family protein n=1 Tax=Candidatus Tisiphia endosymbiont of Xenochironomus xenolabis TaxID=3139334 RepID=UPI0035C88662
MINKDIVNSCIKRVSLLKQDSKPELSEEMVKNVEIKLNIFFPEDFKILCNFYGYDFFRLFSFYNFEDEEGVIEETKYYRKKHNLPSNYLVLFSDDVSFVLLKIISTDKSKVIWCDYQDFFKLCEGHPMQYNPTIFPSFVDFYEYLLDEEEKIRAEDQLLDD